MQVSKNIQFFSVNFLFYSYIYLIQNIKIYKIIYIYL